MAEIKKEWLSMSTIGDTGEGRKKVYKGEISM